jgi:hypothetical protein
MEGIIIPINGIPLWQIEKFGVLLKQKPKIDIPFKVFFYCEENSCPTITLEPQKGDIFTCQSILWWIEEKVIGEAICKQVEEGETLYRLRLDSFKFYGNILDIKEKGKLKELSDFCNTKTNKTIKNVKKPFVYCKEWIV